LRLNIKKLFCSTATSPCPTGKRENRNRGKTERKKIQNSFCVRDVKRTFNNVCETEREKER